MEFVGGNGKFYLERHWPQDDGPNRISFLTAECLIREGGSQRALYSWLSGSTWKVQFGGWMLISANIGSLGLKGNNCWLDQAKRFNFGMDAVWVCQQMAERTSGQIDCSKRE